MSITTEQAEQMAEICDQLGGFAQCATALRSLAAERDDLAKRLKDAERERNHQHGRADRNAAQYAAEQAKREQLKAENKKLRAALSRAKKLFLQDEPQKAFIELCAALGEKE
jgi:hypothetical protein